MAAPPRIRSIARESIPGAPSWMDPLFQILNQAFTQLNSILSKSLTRADNFVGGSKEEISFTTPASGTATVPFKYEMASAPKHLNVSRLTPKVSGTAMPAAWSCTWVVGDNNLINLTFQGLPASTSFLCNVLYE